jgi:histone acetyltransferase (RNA polymerase elongator complex component)
VSQRRRTKSLIIPLFIPNQGCPHRCVFCEQEKITSQPSLPVNAETVRRTLDIALDPGGRRFPHPPELAFYGGTFTRLPEGKMIELLQAAAPYLERGRLTSIRISTRPDAVDQRTACLLRCYGVATVELGAQSMDDEVLELSRRGHRAEDTAESFGLLKRHGFKVGLQLMPGLPGDSREKFMRGLDWVIRLHPNMVRLYPTVVIHGTKLAEWYLTGRYRPLALDAAVEICRESCVRLEAQGIPVIRMGLMSSPSLLEEGQILAGPWHGAFGFLVRSAIYHEKIKPCLPRPGTVPRIRLRVSPREIPLLRGYRNRGLRLVEERTGARVIEVKGDETVPPGRAAYDG